MKQAQGVKRRLDNLAQSLQEFCSSFSDSWHWAGRRRWLPSVARTRSRRFQQTGITPWGMCFWLSIFLKIVSCKIFQKLAELIYTHLWACCWYLTDVNVLSGALDVLQIICADILRPRTILSPYSFTLHLKWRIQKLDSCTSKTSSVFRKLSVDLCLQNRLVGGLDSKTSQPIRPSQIF